MVLRLCIQLVFTHISCLRLQEIWGRKARSASTGKAGWHLDEQTLPVILFRRCLALTEGNCLHGKFSLNTFYCFQIIANDLVSFQFVEAGGLGSPLHLAGSHTALSAHPDLLISEEEIKGKGSETLSSNSWIFRWPVQPAKINNAAPVQTHTKQIFCI